MALSDIAAGLRVTTEQRDRGVASVDDTDRDLRDRLAVVADDLPCDPAAAATVVRAYADGSSVGAAGHEAGVPPMTAAKALHRLGAVGVTPLSPAERDVVADWLAGELSRTEARSLAGASDAEFSLAAYVLTHDPVPTAVEAVEGALAVDGDATVAKRDRLGDALDGAADPR